MLFILFFLPYCFGFHLQYNSITDELVGDTSKLFPIKPQYNYKNISIWFQDSITDDMLHPTYSNDFIPDSYHNDLLFNSIEFFKILEEKGDELIQKSFDEALEKKPLNTSGLKNALHFFLTTKTAYIVSGFKEFDGVAGQAFATLIAYQKNMCWITLNTDYPRVIVNRIDELDGYRFAVNLLAHEFAHSIFAVRDGNETAMVNVFANNVQKEFNKKFPNKFTKEEVNSFNVISPTLFIVGLGMLLPISDIFSLLLFDF